MAPTWCAAWMKNAEEPLRIAPCRTQFFIFPSNRKTGSAQSPEERDADYWKRHGSGLSRDVFDSFLKYQTAMQSTF